MLAAVIEQIIVSFLRVSVFLLFIFYRFALMLNALTECMILMCVHEITRRVNRKHCRQEKKMLSENASNRNIYSLLL